MAALVPAAANAAPGPPTPVTDHCPYRVAPAPAVDASEVVAPGSPTPTALPVPNPPVGGDRLAGCGVIADPAAGPVPGRLTSAGWLIADMDTGAVIAAKDPHGRYRPASTIKVLLALVALDELDLDAPVTATVEDWSAEGDSCGMGPGGHYTVRDMVSGLLVVSGNDCAMALARQLGGVDATLAKMNSLAHDLHALDTRAATPSGLDSAGMSTSPYDLALVFRAAMTHPTFREIIATPTYHFPGYPPRSDVISDTPHPGYEMQTSNHLLLDGYPGILGGKTGYTDDALKTFVGAAERDGRTVLIVQMYGLSTADDSYWTQAGSLLDYGFAAPAGTSVGELVSTSATTRGAEPESAAEHAAASSPTHTDDGTPVSVRIVIGLLAALAILVLLAIATRLTGRRRG
ncbi:D-alanyl-D-alanine carboxypeptidase family protein [Gordonia sp. NB41Y]|uniref:D-alanyl-D-alanine carboxypeptidase family protein n=1 Tax=Gordonia sp. NB41Y TaxID=875808 RepID=UPI00273CACD1|nr:D-alanyl-D-alanine carboxypeptidase family protein [Gordonia sp. NB41Y]WLP92992.1 D-alanyl-D-alanine carboxypeptidase family protein [Gordonia sp. NB41Y]